MAETMNSETIPRIDTPSPLKTVYFKYTEHAVLIV